jgi:hypothetical protein
LYTTCSPHVLQKEELLTKIYLYLLQGLYHSSTQCFLISGHQISKREITNFDDLIFEDINADAVRNKRESEDSESSEEKSSEESSEKEIEPETEAPGILFYSKL